MAKSIHLKIKKRYLNNKIIKTTYKKSTELSMDEK